VASVSIILMNNANATQLTAAIAYWTNCLGKGTKDQRILTERAIVELAARLAALVAARAA
jgi:hypothetical protein